MGKTVSAVVKLVDEFTSPSKKIKTETQNMERRFKSVGDKVKSISGVFSSAGTALTKGFTAPVAALGTASVGAFKEVDAALDTIKQKTGASGDVMKSFKENFEAVASAVPAELEDVGAAIGEINTRLGLTGSALSKSSESFLKFANLNGVNVETAVQDVTRAMGDAGIAAKDYGTVLDQLNVAGQVSGVSIESLTENLAKYGAPMRALGISTQESIAMFSGWEKAGVNTQIAFSGMKKAISNWGKEGKDSSVEFKKTMEEIKKAPDIASATTIAIDTFGSKAGPDLADAIRGGRFEITEYMDALKESGGSVDSTFASTQDGIDKFKVASNKAKVALSEFGGTILGVVSPYIDKLSGGIERLHNWYSKLDESTQRNIVKFALIGASVGPALVGVGKLTNGIGNTITSIGKIGGAVKKLGGAMKLLKFAGVAGGLGLLITAGVLIYKNWDKIVAIFGKAKDAVVRFGSGVKEKAKGAKDALVTFAGSVKQDFADATHRRVEAVKGFFGGAKDFIKNDFYKGAKKGLSKAGDALIDFKNGAKSRIDSVRGSFKSTLGYVKGSFKTGWKKAWTGVRNTFKDAFGAIPGLAKMPINGVIGILNKAIGKINGVSFTMPDWSPIGAGKTFGMHIPTITPLAKGTRDWKGGIAQISEKGGEIVDLPKGSRVYPHDTSIKMARQEAKCQIVLNIAKLADEIIVREKEDLKEIGRQIAEEIVKEIEQAQANMA